MPIDGCRDTSVFLPCSLVEGIGAVRLQLGVALSLSLQAIVGMQYQHIEKLLSSYCDRAFLTVCRGRLSALGQANHAGTSRAVPQVQAVLDHVGLARPNICARRTLASRAPCNLRRREHVE